MSRFRTERALQDAKGAIGMAEYPMRLTPLAPPMAMVMLGLLFPLRERTIPAAISVG